VLSVSEAKVLVAGSSEFFDHFEGLNGKRRMVVTVKAGDTLASIGRRYQTSVGWMERINRRSRSDKLAAGEKLVVYVDRGRYPAQATTQRAVARVPASGVSVASGLSVHDGSARASNRPVQDESTTVIK
jgi:LysM repeat protein